MSAELALLAVRTPARGAVPSLLTYKVANEISYTMSVILKELNKVHPLPCWQKVMQGGADRLRKCLHFLFPSFALLLWGAHTKRPGALEHGIQSSRPMVEIIIILTMSKRSFIICGKNTFLASEH